MAALDTSVSALATRTVEPDAPPTGPASTAAVTLTTLPDHGPSTGAVRMLDDDNENADHADGGEKHLDHHAPQVAVAPSRTPREWGLSVEDDEDISVPAVTRHERPAARDCDATAICVGPRLADSGRH